jgi:hypothetical protein
VQRRFFFGINIGHRTARMASSNTVLSPFCVKAEHSKYFTELISFAIAKPYKWSGDMVSIMKAFTSIQVRSPVDM